MNLIKKEEKKPCRKEGIQEQKLDRELMLLDPDTDHIHILNETAKVIWRLADGRHTLKEMEKKVKERFSVNNGHDVKGDIERVIGELKEKGLLK